MMLLLGCKNKKKKRPNIANMSANRLLLTFKYESLFKSRRDANFILKDSRKEGNKVKVMTGYSVQKYLSTEGMFGGRRNISEEVTITCTQVCTSGFLMHERESSGQQALRVGRESGERVEK